MWLREEYLTYSDPVFTNSNIHNKQEQQKKTKAFFFFFLIYILYLHQTKVTTPSKANHKTESLNMIKVPLVPL